MRKLGLVGGVVATLLCVGAVMAAAPAATAAPGAKSVPAPPKSTPAGTTSGTGAAAPRAAAATAWSAAVTPMTLQGTASFTKHADGTATLQLDMQGLEPQALWTVTIVRGATGAVADRAALFRWQRSDVDRLGNGSAAIHLTAAEYRAIADARTADGFVVLVSDGSRVGLATFARA